MSASEAIKMLKEFSDPDKAKHSYKFFKAIPGGYGEGDKFWGIKVPDQRKVAKKFKHLEFNEIQKLISHKYHEARLTAVILLVYKLEKAGTKLMDEIAAFYLRNLIHINNWDIVDSSCHQILGLFLLNKERDLLYDLAKSENLWERRVAMITCYYFIKKNDFEDALEIAEILVKDDHDLIQKAVGWMLREIGNRNLDKEISFLDQHYKTMPRTMLRYAIEKFEEPLRQYYLKG